MRPQCARFGWRQIATAGSGSGMRAVRPLLAGSGPQGSATDPLRRRDRGARQIVAGVGANEGAAAGAPQPAQGAGPGSSPGGAGGSAAAAASTICCASAMAPWASSGVKYSAGMVSGSASG